MDTALLAQGVGIGFGIAAPVGPIGLLCIRRTLAEGRARGLATGLGAATADAVYGMVAGFGLTLISAWLLGGLFWLRLLGGLFLCWLGWRTAGAPPARQAAPAEGRRGLVGAYLSTFVLTLTNPSTILSFIGIFAGLGLGGTRETGAAVALVAGVFLGSAAWWLLLTGGIGLFRDHMTDQALRWINRLAGAGIILFGLFILGSLLS